MTPHHFVNESKNKIETFKIFVSRIIKSGSFQNGGGFTLIEAIIAIFIIIVGIVAVLQMFPLSVEIEKSAEMATVASQLGQGKIEEIISKSYSNILCPTTTPPYTLSPPCTSTEAYGEISGFNAYKRVLTINYVYPTAEGFQATTTDKGLKKIEVTMHWKSPLGVMEKDLKIAILISKR